MSAAQGTDRNQRGISRVLAKLDNSLETGNYYEAHQMYRTLYFRYTSQEKFAECLEMLFMGALKLIGKKQEASGADLGLLLIDTLEKRGGSQDIDTWIQRLGSIIAQLSSTTVERDTLISRSIKWSGDQTGHSLGHPAMHKLVAQVLWTDGIVDRARHHFLLCRSGYHCGRFLVNLSTSKGYEGEVDLFIIQAILQQLCLSERTAAEETFVTYTTYHPKISRKAPPFPMPLLNFAHLLFRCIDLRRLDTFRALCNFYRAQLSRDESYGKYLQKIGVLYFGAQPRSTGSGGLMGGMFGDLFARLFQGFDDDDDDDASTGPSHSGIRSVQDLD